MTGYIFALVAALGLPLAAAVFMAKRLKRVRPILLGAATFIIFQGFLRIPLLQLVLPRSAEYVMFQFTQPMLYMLFLSLTAGIFEEVGRYLVMRKFMRGSPISDTIAFGIGHGGIEAMLLVGVNLIAIAVTGAMEIQGASPQFFAAGMERIIAMTFHVCLSVMVWRSLKEKQPFLLFVAIILHTLLNAIAVYLSMQQVSVWVIEGSLALMTLLLLLYTIRLIRRDQRI